MATSIRGAIDSIRSTKAAGKRVPKLRRPRKPVDRKKKRERQYARVEEAVEQAVEAVEAEVVDESPASVPSRPPRGSQKRVTKSGSAQLIRRFYSEIPADEWERVLGSHSPASPAGKLYGLIHDAGFRRSKPMTIEKLCAEAGIEFPQLVRLFVEYRGAQALIKAADHQEEVILGMAEDAKSRLYTCDLCVGLRTLTVDHPRDTAQKLEIECPKCGGVGKTRRAGDARARDTFLRVTGTLVEDKQPLVQLNQQFNYGPRHSEHVHRGQQLLEEGRKMRAGATSATNSGSRADSQASGAEFTPESESSE